MKAPKQVPVLASYAYGFRETRRHLPKLIPLSLLFFAPELSEAWAGYAWPGIGAQAYKAALFFAMLLSALRLTRGGPEAGRGSRGAASAYVIAEGLKWCLVLLSFSAGALMAVLVASVLSLDLARIMAGETWMAALPSLLANWWLAQAWWIQWPTLALLGWLPLRVHVALNFAGFFIAEDGLGAMDAVRASIRLSKGAFWSLTWFYALGLILLLLGLSAWVIGAVYTFPVTLLATIHAYRALRGQEEAGLEKT